MTMFKGMKTGFNKTGSNQAIPDPNGTPKTKYMGRGAIPDGPMKYYPGAAGDISTGNRRLAKSNHGDGGGSGTRFSTTGGNAFGRGK